MSLDEYRTGKLLLTSVGAMLFKRLQKQEQLLSRVSLRSRLSAHPKITHSFPNEPSLKYQRVSICTYHREFHPLPLTNAGLTLIRML